MANTHTMRTTKSYELFKSKQTGAIAFKCRKSHSVSNYENDPTDNRVVHLIACSDDEFNHEAKKKLDE